jgi:two-component system cell cycle response regulator DivK
LLIAQRILHAHAAVSQCGCRATRRLKADPDLKAIPIIVVTSYALSGDEDKARAAGCDAYVAKP